MQLYLTIFTTVVLIFFPSAVSTDKNTNPFDISKPVGKGNAHAGITTDDQPMPDEHKPLLNERKKVENQKQIPGAFCGWTFYSLEHITKLTKDVCPQIKEFHTSRPSKPRHRLMSCAPNIPFCSLDSPSYYQGPKELFDNEGPMYVWPIYSNRVRRFLGFKEKVVISITARNRCKLQGVVMRNWRRKWVKCNIRWRWVY